MSVLGPGFVTTAGRGSPTYATVAGYRPLSNNLHYHKYMDVDYGSFGGTMNERVSILRFLEKCRVVSSAFGMFAKSRKRN